MKKMRKILSALAVAFVIWLAGAMGLPEYIMAASLSIEEINYETSTITFKSGAGDVRGYFKKNGSTKWENMAGYFDKDGKISMDISFISASSNYSLNFKGDVSTEEQTVVIPKAASGLKAVYNASNEEKSGTPIKFTNTDDRVVEWRKNNGITWNKWENLSGEQLNYLIANGTTMYFRLAPLNGDSIENAGKRPGKEVSLKISAKKTAPDVKFDDSAFTVSLSSGMQYRIAVMKDGMVSDVDTKNQEWKKITATKEYLLTELCPFALSTECAIQFKNGYKGSTQESRVKTLVIPAQEKLSEAEKSGIEVSYTSTKSLNLRISGASAEKPYQYCIVKKEDYNGGNLSYADLSWTDVKSTAGVAITKTKAPEGSRIYVRKKAYLKLGEEGYAISSKEVCAVEGIVYPEAIGLGDRVRYCVPAGRVNTGDYGTSLTFTIKSYTSTTVSRIIFCNASGGEVGAVAFTSTVAENTSPSKDNSDKYIITVKITDTSQLEKAIDNIYASQNTNYYGTDLYARVTLANDTTAPVDSTENSGLILNLTPKSKIENPASESGTGYGSVFNKHYITNVKRLYMCSSSKNISNSNVDPNGEDNYFKFLLNMGSLKNEENGSDDTEISSITYDDCELFGEGTYNIKISEKDYRDLSTLSDKIFEITYQNYTDTSGKTLRRAFVTVNLEEMEKKLQNIKGSSIKLNTELPLVIKLNNNEVLDSDIKITLVATATIDGGNIYYTDTAGSLPMPYNKKEYDSNGNVTSTSKVTPVEHSFTLSLFKSDYKRAAVKDVTMGSDTGKSVLQSANTVGTTITIELSNAKINNLSGSQSENLYIWFENGFVIKSGCRLTILDGVPESTGSTVMSVNSIRLEAGVDFNSYDAKTSYKASDLTDTMAVSYDAKTLYKAADLTDTMAVSYDAETLYKAEDLTGAAPEAKNVEVTEIDYNALTLTIDSHNNDIVYFSVNKTAWNELDALNIGDGKLKMDISWVSSTSEKKLYFKGNRATTVVTVTIPKVNNKIKAKFSAKYGTITLSNYENADEFLWRKATDYNWKRVDIDEDSDSYKKFVEELEGLRVMGGKIYVMTDQVKGETKNNVLDTGERPSKQIKVSITKRPNMPSVSLNVKTLKLNTSAKMEYYNEKTGKWTACEKSMKLGEISKVPFGDKNTSKASIVLQIRKAATTNSGYSKTRVLSIPSQPDAPKASEAYSAYFETSGSGDNEKKKLVISFPAASDSSPIEYAVVKPDEKFDDSKASWKTMKKPKQLVKLSQKAAPEGTKIYVRYKGVKENEKKGIALKLPSDYVVYEVKYK